MAITLQKRPSEVRTYTFDFSPFVEIVNGDTISSVTTIGATVVQGTGSAPTQSGQAISSDKKQVTVTLSGGSANITVQFLCTVVTVGGSTLELLGNLQILSV